MIGPLIVDATKAFAGLAAIAVAAALFAFFRFTRLGTAIRACADNYTGAQVIGLNVPRLYALTFGLGAACVGAAGAMLALVTDVTPPLGPSFTLLAFVIVIVGGLGSMPGALAGGILIGVIAALAGLFYTPSAKGMRIGGLGGIDDLVFACSGFAEFDVFANRATEQEHILPDIGDVLAQRLTRTQSHILVVDENLAALCVIETQDQIEYRRFSTAGWTDQGGELARLRHKRHSTQYRFVAAVREVNIIKRQSS